MSVIEESKRRSGRIVGLLGLAYLLYGGACASLLGVLLLTGLQAIPDERLLPRYCAVIFCALVPPLLLVVTGWGSRGGHSWARRLAYALPVAFLPLAAVWCGQAAGARLNDPGAAAELMGGLGLGALVALPGATILAVLLWVVGRAGGAGDARSQPVSVSNGSP